MPEMVGRAVQQALVVVDMPFPSYHLGNYKAVENAGGILKQTRCQAVKLEGGADQAGVIAALVVGGHSGHGPCGPATTERPPIRWISSPA